jgi:hypothetical protein
MSRGRPRKNVQEDNVVDEKVEQERMIAEENARQVKEITGYEPKEIKTVPVSEKVEHPKHKDELTTLQQENKKLREQLEQVKLQTAALGDGNDDDVLDAMLIKMMKDKTFGSRLYISLDINNYADFLGLNKNYIKRDKYGVMMPRMVALSVFPDTVNTVDLEQKIALDVGFTLDRNGRSKMADMLRNSEEPYLYKGEIQTTIKEAVQMARREYLKKRLEGDKEHLERQIPQQMQ